MTCIGTALSETQKLISVRHGGSCIARDSGKDKERDCHQVASNQKVDVPTSEA